MNRTDKLLDDPLKFKSELETLLCSEFEFSDAVLVKKALSLVLGVEHVETMRPRGIDVAAILMKLNADAQTIQATLLSEPRIRESLKQSFIEEYFGETIANLVKNINWLNTFAAYSKNIIKAPEQAETLRQMLLAMVDDVRAVIVKLAYRIQRLRNLPGEDYEMRLYIARETLDIYAPLASRLGIGQLKWELEDLAFRYLEPRIYKTLANSLTENRADRENYLGQFIDRLQNLVEREGIMAKIYGRPKHIYSIWRKMQRKQVGFNELYDIRAIRIMVNKISICYEVLGLVHGRWRYIPQEFDDYIANPKSNGYQSLHTVVAGSEGALVEIQIRTHEMDQFAEMGVAAHWRYKEGGKRNAAVEKSIGSLRNFLESKKSDEGLVEDFRTELYSDRIFVLTPDGELKNLIEGATPLDFAYAIHTEVGHRCRGAKVDGRIVNLTYTLKSGERVEILTSKDGGPNRSWLNPNMGYLKTGTALNKVRAWFRQQDHEKNLHDGKGILEKERQRLGIQDLNIDDLLKRFHLSRQEELFIRIGRGDINSIQVANALDIPELSKDTLPVKAPKAKQEKDRIQVQGIGNMLTTFPKCCQPAPGDAIIGYITMGKGVTIHQRECINILSLPVEKQRRLVEVDWGHEDELFSVKIYVEAIDRQGLIKDITQILSNARVNIIDADIHTNKDDFLVHMNLTIEIRNTGELSQVLDGINQLQNILEARREN